MKSLSWTCVTWLTCLGTETGGLWQLHIHLWQKVLVEQSSRKWQVQRFCIIKWRGSIVSEEVQALNQRTGVGSPLTTPVSGQHGEVVFHSNVVDKRDQLARRFIIQTTAREVLGRLVASEAIERIDTTQANEQNRQCDVINGLLSESQGMDVLCVLL